MKSIWKGSIGFGLVNIPIKLYSAVQSSTLSMDMLDSRDHARIRYQRINENTRKEVPYDKIVKGYKLEDDYVILEDQDFADASPEKNKTVEIENFVKLTDINPMYYETSYFAEPEAQGRKAYSLLLKALQKSGKAGVARFVLRSSESLCVIYPVDKVIVISNIRFAEELRSSEEILVPDDVSINKKELDVGLALIDQYTGPFDIKKFKNTYSDELLNIIKLKAKGKRPTIKKLKPAKAASDNLLDQLMESLNARKGA
ncbi:MAG TPA: Ku protein [Sphingobacteriaceae bacterium]|nr:Ku protein [Sphingobacteriaceae bacterium]